MKVHRLTSLFLKEKKWKICLLIVLIGCNLSLAYMYTAQRVLKDSLIAFLTFPDFSGVEEFYLDEPINPNGEDSDMTDEHKSVEILCLVNAPPNEDQLRQMEAAGFRIVDVTGDVITGHISNDQLEPLRSLPSVLSVEIARELEILNEKNEPTSNEEN